MYDDYEYMDDLGDHGCDPFEDDRVEYEDYEDVYDDGRWDDDPNPYHGDYPDDTDDGRYDDDYYEEDDGRYDY